MALIDRSRWVFLYFVETLREKEKNAGNTLSYDTVNPLPRNKIWALTKLKEFADNKFNVAKMLISPFDRVENIVGKRTNCWFPKGYFLGVVKSQDCVVKI